MRTLIIGLVLAVGCMGPVSRVSAEGAPSPKGVMLQVRMPVTSVSSVFNSGIGVPQFAIGVRRKNLACGLGFGLSRASYVDEYSTETFGDKYELNATLFQVAPTIWYDFWSLPDRSTVGTVIGSFQYGRASYRQKYSWRGVGVPNNSESKGHGNLLGFGLAIGGDHYLSPYFSLGVEAGVQGTWVTNLKATDNPAPRLGLSSSLLYGAIRSTIVF